MVMSFDADPIRECTDKLHLVKISIVISCTQKRNFVQFNDRWMTRREVFFLFQIYFFHTDLFRDHVNTTTQYHQANFLML